VRERAEPLSQGDLFIHRNKLIFLSVNLHSYFCGTFLLAPLKENKLYFYNVSQYSSEYGTTHGMGQGL
jgi:hypothetical protein